MKCLNIKKSLIMSNKIYIARIVIETTTPLVIGAGISDLDNDSVVAKDFNFLPYIPGEGLAGIIRDMFERKWDEKITLDIFGGEDDINRDNEKKETNFGSSIEISSGYLVDADADGSVKQQAVKESDLSGFHKIFLNLPKREHVRIEHIGTASKEGKFDNEFVFKGARFKFEVLLNHPNKPGYENLDDFWNSILESINSTGFILGSGTTNGYGQVKVVNVQNRVYDLTLETDFKAYLNYTADLNDPFEGAKPGSIPKELTKTGWLKYEEFNVETKCMHTGAGYGDMDVDDTNYKERVLTWDKGNNPVWKTCFVIPGSSIKGVLSHRVAYHFNKNDTTVEKIISGIVDKTFETEKLKIDADISKIKLKVDAIANGMDSPEEKKKQMESIITELSAFKFTGIKTTNDFLYDFTGEKNAEVKNTFGFASVSENEPGSIGNIIADDIYIDADEVDETIFEHNEIDRFTAATIIKALYSEKVFTPKLPFKINIKLDNKNKVPAGYFDKAVDDLINGNLPVGGKTNKGYGYFKLKQ